SSLSSCTMRSNIASVTATAVVRPSRRAWRNSISDREVKSITISSDNTFYRADVDAEVMLRGNKNNPNGAGPGYARPIPLHHRPEPAESKTDPARWPGHYRGQPPTAVRAAPHPRGTHSHAAGRGPWEPHHPSQARSVAPRRPARRRAAPGIAQSLPLSGAGAPDGPLFALLLWSGPSGHHLICFFLVSAKLLLIFLLRPEVLRSRQSVNVQNAVQVVNFVLEDTCIPVV